MFHFALGKLGAAVRAGTGSAGGVVPLFSRDYEATGSLGADATFTRASTATYVDSNGVIQTAAINTPRFDYSTGSRALLMEPAATNYLLNSGTPATQTTGSLGTGDYVLWVEGAGSAAVTAGTATITGGGTATDGTPDTFTVTGAGTVTVTVTGTLDRFQLELGSTPTSYIPTSGSAVTRAADALSYSAAGNISATAGTAIIENYVQSFNGDELLAATNILGDLVTGRIIYHHQANTTLASYGGGAVVIPPIPNGVMEKNKKYNIAVRWESGGKHRLGIRNVTDSGSWVWDAMNSNYNDFEITSLNMLNSVSTRSGIWMQAGGVKIYNDDRGQDWIEANY